jgi:hypothetical protein
MFEKLKEKAKGAKVRLALAASTASLMLVSSVSAVEINWTEITSILDGVVDIFPSILTLVVNIFPIIIVVAIIGFVIGFLDKILGMLNFRF